MGRGEWVRLGAPAVRVGKPRKVEAAGGWAVSMGIVCRWSTGPLFLQTGFHFAERSSEVPSRDKLLELIDKREQAAVSLALEVKDKSPAEIAEKMAPFVAESERQGLELLTVEQRALLDQLRLARQGLSSLGYRIEAQGRSLCFATQFGIESMNLQNIRF